MLLTHRNTSKIFSAQTSGQLIEVILRNEAMPPLTQQMHIRVLLIQSNMNLT